MDTLSRNNVRKDKPELENRDYWALGEKRNPPVIQFTVPVTRR